jgi:tRNA dimethylallyltransferase
MMDRRKLIVICGPTASGKSALAVDLALQFGGEVVSADSMQVYRGMDIGTAKPTPAEMRGVPHHMLDCADIAEEYSAAVYREHARACIADIAGRGKMPILCGGTGLYVSATVYPLDFNNAVADEAYRRELHEFARLHGNEALHRRLGELSLETAAAVHPNNVRRVVRALERLRISGRKTGAQSIFNGEPLYDMAWIGLKMPRDELYRRIDARVDDMMRRGLLEEVQGLAGRYGRDATAFQALGYKELLEHIDGRSSLDDAIERINRGTRNYAKRQMTWFKRENAIRWFDVPVYESRETLTQAAAGYIRDTLHI